MKKISVEEIHAGQRFSRPVYVDEDNLFVPEGIAVRDRDLDRLRKWEIKTLFTEGEPISDDPQAAFNAFFLRAFNSPAQKAITKVYGGFRTALMEIFGRIRGEENVEQDEINRIVDKILRLLEGHPNDVVQYMLYGMQGETGEVENALNTAILAALVGQKMQLPRHRILVLVTAALLHDVGMLRIPQEILAKQGKLTAEEKRQVQTHPVYSYKIITRDLSFGEDVGIAALQHQERWDGNGYPRRLARDSIRVEARIITVADSFVAMVSNKPYRLSMIGYTAMRNLLSDNGTRFDPEVLKVFIQVLGIYPIGSIVLLSDASVCRVLENRSAAPLKPRVKVIIDSEGHEFIDDDGPEIDLGETKNVFIARAVDANSLAEHHRTG
ncbi:MAG: HD-GYP domain-containing protein [Spirochaetaceae bacterium]|nr:MAG: HD-GYP domain-containing protein [Spirochaetaceae bacterium]